MVFSFFYQRFFLHSIYSSVPYTISAIIFNINNISCWAACILLLLSFVVFLSVSIKLRILKCHAINGKDWKGKKLFSGTPVKHRELAVFFSAGQHIFIFYPVVKQNHRYLASTQIEHISKYVICLSVPEPLNHHINHVSITATKW